MTAAAQILLSGALTFGVPLALAVRDLMSLRRGPGGGSWPPQPQTPPPQPSSGGPAIRRELPACLIPVRARLEPEVQSRLREFA